MQQKYASMERLCSCGGNFPCLSHTFPQIPYMRSISACPPRAITAKLSRCVQAIHLLMPFLPSSISFAVTASGARSLSRP